MAKKALYRITSVYASLQLGTWGHCAFASCVIPRGNIDLSGDPAARLFQMGIRDEMMTDSPNGSG